MNKDLADKYKTVAQQYIGKLIKIKSKDYIFTEILTKITKDPSDTISYEVFGKLESKNSSRFITKDLAWIVQKLAPKTKNRKG